jgi:hypothetical protein
VARVTDFPEEIPFDDDDIECQHESYEIDWDGRAHCDYCPAVWSPSPAEIQARDAWQRKVDREYARQFRWYRRAWRRLVDCVAAYSTPRQKVIDDEIPF